MGNFFLIEYSDAICHYQWSVSLAEFLLSNKGVKLLLSKIFSDTKYKVDSINNPAQTLIKVANLLV